MSNPNSRSNHRLPSLALGAVLLGVAPPSAQAQTALEEAQSLVKSKSRDAAAIEALLVKADAERQVKEAAQEAKVKAAEDEAKVATAAADDAKEQAAKSQAAAEVAAKDSEDKAIAFDAAVSGKLIESGITAGVAGLLHVPLKRSWGASTIESGHTMEATPFVAFLPAYMVGKGPERAKYCASRWTGTEVEAQRVADDMAKKRADRIADELITRVSAGADGESEILAEAAGSGIDAGTVRDRLVTLAKTATSSVADRAKVARAALVGMLAERVIEWTPGKPASCLIYSLGAWVTPFPGSQTMDVRGPNGALQEAKAKRWVSFGLAWVPSAYASVLLGGSYGSVEIEGLGSDGTTRTESIIRLWSATVGISINADIATIANDSSPSKS